MYQISIQSVIFLYLHFLVKNYEKLEIKKYSEFVKFTNFLYLNFLAENYEKLEIKKNCEFVEVKIFSTCTKIYFFVFH